VVQLFRKKFLFVLLFLFFFLLFFSVEEKKKKKQLRKQCARPRSSSHTRILLELLNKYSEWEKV